MTVREIPSRATEPFSAINAFSRSSTAITSLCESPSASISCKLASPSTWPDTICPPSSSPSLRAGSRFICVPICQPDSVVRASVSADTSTKKLSVVVSTTVRHTPEHAIDAPNDRWSHCHGAAISNCQSPVLVTERTCPIAVIIPVNIYLPISIFLALLQALIKAVYFSQIIFKPEAVCFDIGCWKLKIYLRNNLIFRRKGWQTRT